VRHHEIGLGDLKVSDEKNVDVQLTGSVAHGPNPARQVLEPVCNLEKLARTERGLEPDNAIGRPRSGHAVSDL